MKIHVKAKPNAKHAAVEKLGENNFVVSVKEQAKDGQANIAVQEGLAEYFKVGVSRVRLVSGFSSRNKIFEIEKN